jgi:ATP-dependent RNA helicase DeaD
MSTSLDQVPEALARALAARGYTVLTPVQRAVLDPDRRERDLLVSAETGSGKTIAFGLALAVRLVGPDGRADAGPPRALVITPTRELAHQVTGELAWLFAGAGARVLCCTGGMDMRAERTRLAGGCAIVVGSPGRLRDHIERGALDTRLVAAVVLDEADDMLDMGFRGDLEFILDAAAPERRILMFSATVTPRIETLAARYQRDAARIEAAADAGAAPDIRFEAVSVAPNDRENAIVNLLRFHDARGAIVFCARRETVAHLASRLDNRGFQVVALSGALPQPARAAALAALRDGRARVCVATDLAARGLDLPGLELVIHADLPPSEAALVHRSGRTGRAGRRGRAVLVVPHPLRRRAEALADRAGLVLAWASAPSREAILARDEARMLDDDAFGDPAAPEERAAAARLLARHDGERVAVALIRAWARTLPAPELLIGSEPDPARGRTRLVRAVWFRLDCGRVGGAEPRWVLPLICRLGHVTRRDIGLLEVRERDTRFEIAAEAADAFAAAVARSTAADVADVTITRETPPADRA